MSAKNETKTAVVKLNKIAILYTPNKQNTALNTSLNTLYQALPKTGKEVFLVIKSDEQQPFIDNKNTKELIDTGRCYFENNTDLIADADFVLMIDDATIAQLKAFLQQTLKAQTSPQKKQVQVAVTAKTKTAKWVLYFNALFLKLLAGINLNRAFLNLVLMPKTAYQNLLSEFPNLSANDGGKMLGILRLLGYKINECAIDTDAKNIQTKSLVSIFNLSIWLRWYWFVKLPLAMLSNKNNKYEHIISLDSNKYFGYRFAFFVVAALVFVGMPVLSFSFGTIWDELIQKNYANDMLNYFLTFGEDKTCLDTTKHLYNNMIYYGSFFDLLATAFYHTTGLFGEYESRHFLNAIFGAVAIIYTGMIGREIGNWRLGLIALLFILLTPGFFGHSMNNPKDIPFATAYVFSIYQLIRFIKQLPKPNTATVVYLCLGIALSISIRIGGLLLIAYLAMFMFLKWIEITKKESFSTSGKLLVPFFSKFLLVAVASYILGILFWPYALQNPLKNPLIALQNFSNFSGLLYTYEIFEGKRTYMAQVPWYYLPKQLLYGVPTVIWAGVVLFVLAVWQMIKNKQLLVLGLILFVAIFPPFYAIYKHSMLYNGWRHFIFIVPIIALIGATGWEALLGLVKHKVAVTVGLVLIAIGCSMPLTWAIKNHPNQYVYFNEICGGMKNAYGNFELDYYSNSCRQAAEWIAKDAPHKKILVGINNEPVTASYYAQKINDSIQFQWVREYEEFKPRWDYLILTSRTFSKHELLNGAFPPKGTVHTINVNGYPICAVVKRQNTFMPDGYDAMARKSVDTAIMCFKQAIAYDPLNEEGYRMLGTAYSMKNEFKLAEEAFNKSIELYPENYSTFSSLGQMWYMQQQPDKALEMLKKGIELKKNLTEAYFYAGQCELQKNNFSGAAVYFENGTKNNGVIPEMFYGLGVANFNLGSIKAAEDALINALSLNQNYAPAYYMLAQVFQKANEPAKAQECMNRYQQLTGGAQ